MKLTERKINHFKVSNSLAYSTFTGFNHNLPLVPDILITSEGNPEGFKLVILVVLLLICKAATNLLFCLWICLFCMFHINGNMQYVTFSF